MIDVMAIKIRHVWHIVITVINYNLYYIFHNLRIYGICQQKCSILLKKEGVGISGGVKLWQNNLLRIFWITKQGRSFRFVVVSEFLHKLLQVGMFC